MTYGTSWDLVSGLRPSLTLDVPGSLGDLFGWCVSIKLPCPSELLRSSCFLTTVQGPISSQNVVLFSVGFFKPRMTIIIPQISTVFFFKALKLSVLPGNWTYTLWVPELLSYPWVSTVLNSELSRTQTQNYSWIPESIPPNCLILMYWYMLAAVFSP